jgi:hypothetical protein
VAQALQSATVGVRASSAPKEQPVAFHRILSLITALAVSSVARAESTPSSDTAAQPADAQATPTKPKKVKKHPNKTQLDKAERGNPHSVIYKSRKKKTPNPTNEQLQASESENPASVDFANRKAATHSPTNAEIRDGEKGNPETVQETNK